MKRTCQLITARAPCQRYVYSCGCRRKHSVDAYRVGIHSRREGISVHKTALLCCAGYRLRTADSRKFTRAICVSRRLTLYTRHSAIVLAIKRIILPFLAHVLA